MRHPVQADCPIHDHCRIHIDKIGQRGFSEHVKTLELPERKKEMNQVLVMEKSKEELPIVTSMYEMLGRRLEPLTHKLSEEDQAELDGIIYEFCKDVATAVTNVFIKR